MGASSQRRCAEGRLPVADWARAKRVWPSKNVTVPVGVPPVEPFTGAVNVTVCPTTEGFNEEARAVAGTVVGLPSVCVAVPEIVPTAPVTVSVPATVPV